MKEQDFITGFAEIVRSGLTGPEVRGRERRIALLGHFNYREFHTRRFPTMRLSLWLRLMRNMAMEMTEREFYRLWQQLGTLIYETAERHGDELNQEHARRR